jgi:hypothetical protein
MIDNKDLVGKFFIISNLQFTDYFKDEKGEIMIFDTQEEAYQRAWIYELDDALICEIKRNYKETYSYNFIE